MAAASIVVYLGLATVIAGLVGFTLGVVGTYYGLRRADAMAAMRRTAEQRIARYRLRKSSSASCTGGRP